MSKVNGNLSSALSPEWIRRRVENYLRIAVVTRFLAIAGVLLASRLPALKPLDMQIFWAFIALETVANLVYFLFGFKRWPHLAFHFSGVIDIVAISFLVFLTGGSTSLFIPLYTLVIVFNGMFYGWTGFFSGTGLSIIGFLLAAGLGPYELATRAVAVHIGVWAGLGFLSGIVGEREKKDRLDLFSRTEQIDAIYRTSSAINTPIEAEALLTTAAEQTLRLARQKWGEDAAVAITLIDEGAGEVEVVRTLGTKPSTRPGLKIPLRILEEEQRTRLLSTKPFVVSRTEIFRFVENRFDFPTDCSLIVAPVVRGGVPLGHLIVRSRVDELRVTDDLEVLETIANHLAAALTRIQELEHERTRRVQAIGLFELTRDLSSLYSIDDVLTRVAEGALALARVDSAALGVLSDEGSSILPKGWALAGAAAPTREQIESLGDIPIDEISEIFVERRPMVIDDVASTSELKRAFAALFGTRSAAIFPIIVNDRPLGALAIGHTDAKSFSIEQLQTAESIAGVAGIAIDNLKLREVENRRALQNAALFEVARLIASTLEADEVIDRVLESSIRATRALRAVIYSIDEGHLLPSLCRNRDGVCAGEFSELDPIPLSDTVKEFLEEGRVRMMAEGSALLPDQWIAAEEDGAHHIVAPLAIRGENLGILLVELPADAPENEWPIRLIQGIASLASLALHNAKSYKAEKEAVAQLRELDRLKTEFVSTASHELRSPVTSIAGYARTLLRPGANLSDEERRDFIEVIDRQAKQLARLIDELLTVSRLEEGRMSISFHPVDVARMAEDLCSEFRIRTDVHSFQTRFPEHFPMLVADESKILEILTNLVDNAVKYSPDGGKVTIGGQIQDHKATLFVADEGPGMSPEDAERIFEKFFQAEDRPRVHGAGLGLFIVKELVKAHGGEIWVETSPGQGATFYVSLPQRRAADRLVASIEPETTP